MSNYSKTKKPRLRNDLTGQKYGNLTVIGWAERRLYSNGIWINVWNCLCDCGVTCQRVQRALLDQVKNNSMTSCGCLGSAVQQKRKNYGFGSVNALMTGYKINARHANREFSLEIEVFRQLTKENCYYCGVAPYQVLTNGKCTPYVYNGLDRIDSSRGYSIDNVRPCCGVCNSAKNDLSESEFYIWIKRLVEKGVYEERNTIQRDSHDVGRGQISIET